jgi:hypothetical protein
LAIRTARSRLLISRREADNKFIATFVELSIARERFGGNPDSLNLAYHDIYLRNNTDSLWIADYAKKLSGQIEKTEEIWGRIVSKFDSLQKNPPTINLK